MKSTATFAGLVSQADLGSQLGAAVASVLPTTTEPATLSNWLLWDDGPGERLAWDGAGGIFLWE